MHRPAANANQQVAALQKLIQSRKADGKVTAAEARGIVAQAKRENVQIGELQQLRSLASSKLLDAAAKRPFTRDVDQMVPAGAPTAKLAAITLRVDPATGRKQLLALLDGARNPVPGGPKTFVVTGLGPPYLAGITTGQVMNGLVRYLDGATPQQATKLRHYLGQQLKALELPVSRGGLAIPGIVRAPRGLSLSVDTRVGSIGAVNQNAVVLKALEKVSQLEGPQNAAIARKARTLAHKMIRELKAELPFAYPSSGRLSYSVAIRNGRAVSTRFEDGNHLKTTLDALKGLKVFRPHFEKDIRRVEKRFPEIAFAEPADLSGDAGRIYSPTFETFLAEARRIERKSTVTARDVARLETLARSQGLLTRGEKGVIERVKKRVA